MQIPNYGFGRPLYVRLPTTDSNNPCNWWVCDTKQRVRTLSLNFLGHQALLVFKSHLPSHLAPLPLRVIHGLMDEERARKDTVLFRVINNSVLKITLWFLFFLVKVNERFNFCGWLSHCLIPGVRLCIKGLSFHTDQQSDLRKSLDVHPNINNSFNVHTHVNKE